MTASRDTVLPHIPSYLFRFRTFHFTDCPPSFFVSPISGLFVRSSPTVSCNLLYILLLFPSTPLLHAITWMDKWLLLQTMRTVIGIAWRCNDRGPLPRYDPGDLWFEAFLLQFAVISTLNWHWYVEDTIWFPARFQVILERRSFASRWLLVSRNDISRASYKFLRHSSRQAYDEILNFSEKPVRITNLGKRY